MPYDIVTCQFGSVDQWAGRWSSGRQTFPTLRPIYGRRAGKLSAMGKPTKPTQPSIPRGLVNE